MTSTTPVTGPAAMRYNPAAIQRPGRKRPGYRWSLETQMGGVRPRCTVASLRAVGVEPHALPEYWGDVARELREAGVAYETATDFRYGATTLGQYVASHPTGRYLIGTYGHAMALVDGVLVDTAARTSARKITEVIVVKDERTPIAQDWRRIARFMANGPSRLVRYTEGDTMGAQGRTPRQIAARAGMHPVRRAALDAKRVKGHKGGRPNARRLTDYELRAWVRHLHTRWDDASSTDLRDYALWVADISVSYRRWDAAWAAVVG